MARKKKKRSLKTIAITIAIALLLVVAYGFYLYKFENDKFNSIYNRIFGQQSSSKEDIIVEGELSIHFLELGNKSAGDCTYIKAGDVDILVDAGSEYSSVSTISKYLNDYIDDGVLEYVIITHADFDHIAGFAKKEGSIFELYDCKTIIDFPLSDKDSTAYNNYIINRQEEIDAGAKHYTALECYNNEGDARRTYNLTNEVSLNFLYQRYYEERDNDENNYSVCFMLTHGSKNFLFTGDLEEEGERSLVNENNLPEVELFKAGHHGSPTSSNDFLLEVIKPKIVCVCCCAGSVEYTQNMANTFPSQAFIDRVSEYTDEVYVPIFVEVIYSDEKGKYVNADDYHLLNGNITVTSSKKGIEVSGSNNNTKLKDTEWFKANRNIPSYWQDT